jgi:phage regulator Rha-like protein
MTKDGFTFLAMGYTGAKAAAFKVAYIQGRGRPGKRLVAAKYVKREGGDEA